MRQQGHVREEPADVFNKVIRGSVVAPVADNEAKLGQSENGRGICATTADIRTIIAPKRTTGTNLGPRRYPCQIGQVKGD